MRFNAAHLEAAQVGLASIPLFPILKWNSKEGDTDESVFRTVKLELKTNPTAADSVKFSSYFKVFENGTAEQWCRWREDLTTVFKGLNLTTGPNQIGMVRHLLGGQALDTFNVYFTEAGVTETPANMLNGLRKVAATVFNDNAVTNQKQYLRHALKKSNKLTARETSTRLLQLNTWLEYYPADGVDPTATITKLDENELREIYYRLLPSIWRRKMDENVQFDRVRDGLRGLIDYAERLETSEQVFDGKSSQNGIVKGNSHDGSQKPDGKAKKGKPETGHANSDGNRFTPTWTRDCLVHGDKCGHPSHKCKVLIDHAKKVRGQFKAQYKDKNAYKKSSPSKPWKRDNQDRSYSKKEVQVLLKRQQERKKEAIVEVHAMNAEPIQDDVYVDKRGRPVNMDEVDDELDNMFVE